MRINVKSQTLEGYNFQNNVFRKKIQTFSKPALKNTFFLKKIFEVREGCGKMHFSQNNHIKCEIVNYCITTRTAV